MSNAFYSGAISAFIHSEENDVLACMVKANPFDLNDMQRDAWIEEIGILKNQLRGFEQGRLLLEYVIPRIGKRVDAVVLYGGIVFLLEFKVYSREYP